MGAGVSAFSAMHSSVADQDCEGSRIKLTNYVKKKGSFTKLGVPDQVPFREKRGFLEIEEEDTFKTRFCILRHKEMVLEFLDGDPFTSRAKLTGKVELAYITKVVIGNQKARSNYTFEINTPSKKYTLAAETADERDSWIEVLKRAAVTPHTERSQLPKTTSIVNEESHDSMSYETAIIGGVVVKTPVLVEANTYERCASAASESAPSGVRMYMEGWCCKQGAVMKNWKRRYFRLNVIKLSYFENEKVKEPIRSILSRDIRGVQILSTFANRKNIVEVETPYRKFYMQPDNEEDIKAWKVAVEEVMAANGSCLPRTKSV